MRIELLFTLPFKAVALISTVLLAREFLVFPEIYSELIYLLGWVNILKIFDLSLPYLLRISFPDKIKIVPYEIVLYALALSLFNYIVLRWFTEFSDFEIVLLVVSSRLYSYLLYSLNVAQQSFLINFSLSIATLVFIAFRYSGAPLSPTSFLLIYAIATAIFASYAYFSLKYLTMGFETKSISRLADSNYVFNVVTMSLWALSSELYSVYSLDVLSAENYDRINQFMRVSLIFLGITHIVSNVNWNHFYSKISSVDSFLLNIRYSICLFPIILLLVVLIGDGFTYSESFTVSMFSFLSMQTLYLSQLCARLSQSRALMVVSIFELGLLFIGLQVFSEAFFLLVFSTITQFLKFLFLRAHVKV